MGVAGATSDNGIIVLAGVAGLIAGAFSMGVGEYVSVQSQRELLDFQLAFQRKQLRDAPDQERAILAKLYAERGFGPEEADRFVDAVFADPDHTVRLLIFEEVGLDARSIGSPLAAAAGSFVAFTTGAFIPLARTSSAPGCRRSWPACWSAWGHWHSSGRGSPPSHADRRGMGPCARSASGPSRPGSPTPSAS